MFRVICIPGVALQLILCAHAPGNDVPILQAASTTVDPRLSNARPELVKGRSSHARHHQHTHGAKLVSSRPWKQWKIVGSFYVQFWKARNTEKSLEKDGNSFFAGQIKALRFRNSVNKKRS
jgi:hypothetical protein